MAQQPVTDPALLRRLETQRQAATDPALIARLDAARGAPSAPVSREGMPYSMAESIENLGPSAVQYGKSMYEAVTSPIQTATGLGRVALGYLDQGAEAATEALPEPVVQAVNRFNNLLVDLGAPLDRLPETGAGELDHMQYAEAMNDFIKARYGSWDRFKRTAESDPVGVLGDVSAVLTAAGGLSGVGLLGKAGAAAEPMTAPLALIQGATRTTAKLIPKKLYQSAAKMETGKGFTGAQRARVIETALDQQIPPTTSGMNRAGTMIDALSGKVDDVIAAARPGDRIPVDAIFKGFKELRQAAKESPADAARDLRLIDRYAKDFMQWQKSKGRDSYTVKELNQFKRSQYRKIGPKGYSRAPGGKEAPIMETVRKTAARGAREAIESRVPEVKELNSLLGDLIELQDAIARPAKRIENMNIIGLDDAAKIATASGAGYMAGGSGGSAIGTTIGVMAAILGNPNVKSRIAIQMHKLSKKGLLDQYLRENFSPEVAQVLKSSMGPGGRVTAAQAGRMSEVTEETE